MKPLRCEKGNNGVFRVSINQFPQIFGIGKTEGEAFADFLLKFEEWGNDDLDRLEKWFRRVRKELGKFERDDRAIPFVNLDKPI